VRAIAVEKFGEAPRLMELPVPTPGPGELLVRLTAASPNPFDRAIYGGFLRHLPHVFPLVLGVDGAGIVEDVGDGARRFDIGDSVYGTFAHEPLGKGTFAEYVAVPEGALLAKAPDAIPLAEAAAMPTAGMSAVGLLEEAEPSPGDSLLILGASGGVGSLAVQLAFRSGVRVIASARADAEQQVKDLGAALTLDYAQDSVAPQLREIEPEGVDILLDLVSDADGFLESTRLVRDGGKAISLRYAAKEDSGRIRASNFNLREHPHAARFLADLTDALEGGLKPVIDKRIALEQAPRFLESRVSGGARGKALISI
jgi:NADPH2:quinone reductase